MLKVFTRVLWVAHPNVSSHASTASLATPTPQSLSDLGRAIGADLLRTMRALDRLASAGVIVQRREGWALPRGDRRGSAAKRLGVEGRLRHRAQTYAIEREHEPVTELERMLADKLGARLIGVESYEPWPMKAIA